MSFRHPFITDFIYQGGDDVKESNPKLTKVFNQHGTLCNQITESGLGYYAGMMRTSSLGCELSEMGLEEFVSDLEKVTKVPFRLTVMQESGAVITYSIEPRKS